MIVTETYFPELILAHRGKVRDMYEIPGHDDKLLMVATDRISAYDVVMNDPIPGKGKILTEMSLSWFKLLGDVVENHLITADVDQYPAVCQPYADQLRGRSMLVKKAKPLPVECIVRGYLSGSFWSAYKKNTMVCGFNLPKGMQESDKFSEPLFTPSTKAEQGMHDENISFETLAGIVGFSRALELKRISIDLYRMASYYAEFRGIIIADTKFEMGLDDDGNLLLIDEVLTPDSSRFWPLDQYIPGKGQPSFDKQFLRNYLQGLFDAGKWDKTPPPPVLPQEIIQITAGRYEEANQRLTGH